MQNRPFPSSLVPLFFQSESKCETFHMKMSSARSQFFFMHHKNGFALRLALKQRLEGTRKWPIDPFASFACQTVDNLTIVKPDSICIAQITY